LRQRDGAAFGGILILAEFADKVVVVTGASRGLGAAVAAAFASQGATVCANHIPDEAGERVRAIERWRDEAGIGPEQVVPLAADVSVAREVEAMFATIAERFGRIDVLVNNAAVKRDHTVIKMTDEEWRSVLAVNLDGMFFCCRAAIPLLRDGGRIINLSSVVAHTGSFGVANYATTKAGALGLTKTLALELASRGITVNALCPGFIDVGMAREIPEQVLARIIEGVPLKRMGRVEEVTPCVLFLASGQASYITGQSLNVNGGLYMGG